MTSVQHYLKMAARMTMRVLAVILALAGGRALAELPPQECHDAGFGSYDVIWHHGGFVMYPGPYSPQDYRLMLEDCVNDRALSIVLPYAGTDLVEKWAGDEALIFAVEGALRSDRRYTLRQIGGIARRQGAAATLGKAATESCACDKYGVINP